MQATNAVHLQEFIEIYHTNEALWNVKHPDYNKPKVRAECYDALVYKMQEMQADATRDDVVKKINSIRCSFRKEYRKVMMNMRLGKPYTPRLWYYRNLLFLLEQEAPAKEPEYEETEETQDEELPPEVITDEVEEPEDPLGQQYHHHQSEEDDHVTYTRRAVHVESTSTVRRKKPNRARETNRLMETHKVRETHAEIFGKHVAAKLAMIRQDQRMFLEKLINDAIFEAEMGNLGRDCRIVL